jgi:hypothetical protein
LISVIANVPATISFSVPAVLVIAFYLIVVIRWEVVSRRAKKDDLQSSSVAMKASVSTRKGEATEDIEIEPEIIAAPA